jgi:molybdopterin converting factor small subunit
MVVKVLSYGKLADLLGREASVEVPPPCTVANLRATLAEQFPQAAMILSDRRVRACIGDDIVPDGHVLGDIQPVELLAPVSGG